MDATFTVRLLACEAAADGRDALSAATDGPSNRSRCVVLALVDLDMPGMDGSSAARALRHAGAAAPLVACTPGPVPNRITFETLLRVEA